MPEVIINGPEGRIEARYHHNEDPTAPIALILHPHPEHGGTMNNKVVYAMFQGFVNRNFSTLRFNFRGVGRSQGVHDRGEGELCDAAAALDWLQTCNPNASNCWVTGFSFGAWIGMQLLMRRPEISGFVSIAPPANTRDFTFLAPCPASGMIIQGTEDDLVTEESVSKLVEKISSQKNVEVDYRMIDGADHFFGSKHDELVEHLHDYLNTAMAPAE